jgi:2-iminobutanoate/2-iminopropanoate deaminase
LKNLDAILKAAGTSPDKVVKTTVLLANIEDWPEVNKVYAKYFPDAPPARAAYAVKALPMGALVEIEAIAAE